MRLSPPRIVSLPHRSATKFESGAQRLFRARTLGNFSNGISEKGPTLVLHMVMLLAKSPECWEMREKSRRGKTDQPTHMKAKFWIPSHRKNAIKYSAIGTLSTVSTLSRKFGNRVLRFHSCGHIR